MGWIAAKVVPSDERRQEKKNQLSNSKDLQDQPPPKRNFLSKTETGHMIKRQFKR